MIEPIKTVVVDDEVGALNAVLSIIKRTAPEFQVVGTAQNVTTAYEVIMLEQPGLVFLDIQLKDQTGFDLLQLPFDQAFEVVFVTAYDEYAIRAFQVNALSYLLKPVSIQAFLHLKDRVLHVIGSTEERSSTRAHSVLGNKIAIPNGSAVDYLVPEEIMYIKADGSYSEIHLQDGSKVMLSKGLSHLQSRLSDQVFLRPHRSFIVNCTCVKRWNKADGGWLIVNDNQKIPISRSGRTVVEQFFGHS